MGTQQRENAQRDGKQHSKGKFCNDELRAEKGNIDGRELLEIDAHRIETPLDALRSKLEPTCDQRDASSRMPFSNFSWHSMQCRVQGTASNRLGLISVPQDMHSPKLPSRIRDSAFSTIISSWRSLLLW